MKSSTMQQVQPRVILPPVVGIKPDRSSPLMDVNTATGIRFQDNKVNSRITFGKVCKIILEGGKKALWNYFDQQHRDEALAKWLCDPTIQKTIRRLSIRGIITRSHEACLHPRMFQENQDHRSYLNDQCDLSLLLVLLKYLSHIWPPEGYQSWSAALSAPLPHNFDKDSSNSAMLLRFQLCRRSLAAVESMNKSTYKQILRDLTRTLTHFGGESLRHWVQAVLQTPVEAFDTGDAAWYVDQFRDWHTHEEVVIKKEEMTQSAREKRANDIPTLQRKMIPRDKSMEVLPNLRSNVHRRVERQPFIKDGQIVNRWADIRTGMSTEEKNIIEKYYVRLVNDVKPDAIIDHLVNRRILTMEESNDIFSILKPLEQMQLLLDIIIPKPGQVFTEFLNSLRGRYNQLQQTILDDYNKMMEAIRASKPDGLPYCRSILIDLYNHMSHTWCPIRWYPEAKVALDSFYCPLQILDNRGNLADIQRVFSCDDRDTRIAIIEGGDGTGKSTLARYVVHHWTLNQNFFHIPFLLVLMLDLKISAVTLKWMMVEQLFGENSKLSEKELWTVIEENEHRVLIVLDGYEDNANDDVQALLAGDLLPQAHILVLAHSSFSKNLTADVPTHNKYILTGFSRRQAEQFVRKYARISRRPADTFQNLLGLLETKDNERLRSEELGGSMEDFVELPSFSAGRSGELTTISEVPESAGAIFNRRSSKPTNLPVEPIAEPSAEYTPDSAKLNDAMKLYGTVVTTTNVDKSGTMLNYFSQVPLYCGFFCAMADLRMSVEVTSWTTMLEHFLTAIKMKLIERDKESRFAVNRAHSQLTEMALDTMKTSMSTVYVHEPQTDPLVRFGILQEASNIPPVVLPASRDSARSSPPLEPLNNTRYCFPNRLLQEYLAAKCLDSSATDEASRFFSSLQLNRHMHNIALFYCGLKKSESETLALRTLYSKIVELNLRMRKSRPRQELVRQSSTTTTADSPANSQQYYGRIMNFQLSLECIALMEGRSDLSRSLSRTLPESIVVDHDGIIPVLSLHGLAFMIQSNNECIRELDIRLSLLSQQSPEAFLRLAESVHTSKSIRTLRIIWEQKNLMTDFFRTVCEKNDSLERIECIDESGLTRERLSAKVWLDIRQACKSMNTVRHFAFQQCRHVGLVTAVIRNLPDSLEELDLTGSHLNIIACDEVSEKIKNSKTLRGLNFSEVHMEGIAFNTFIKSLANNRSVTRLNLSGMQLDNVNFFALAEALKSNTRLESVDLRDVTVNLHNCTELALVTRVNFNLKHLHLTGNRVIEEGRALLLNAAKHTQIHGIDAYIRLKKKNSEATLKFEE